jgi:cyclopropane fatty-acyl-phospholipid synthase-like methyltransferase
MEHQPARSEYKEVWSALSTTEDQAKLHVIGVTEEAALQATGEETLRFPQDSVGIGKEDVVLEIGCGIGRVGKVVAPLCRKWIGCDVASNMLSLAFG